MHAASFAFAMLLSRSLRILLLSWLLKKMGSIKRFEYFEYSFRVFVSSSAMLSFFSSCKLFRIVHESSKLNAPLNASVYCATSLYLFQHSPMVITSGFTSLRESVNSFHHSTFFA